MDGKSERSEIERTLKELHSKFLWFLTKYFLERRWVASPIPYRYID